ncbi:MAG TPA: NAD-glutamate dehydrogenase [Thermoanaerobaculia bacterium]|nr:NAD-glutamate dehydrogenase [Thermoanaerobaculia bacterium]
MARPPEIHQGPASPAPPPSPSVFSRIEQLAEGLDAEEASFARFLRVFYADVPKRDLADRADEELIAAARAIWRHGRQRIPGVAKVRVYNPSGERHGWSSPHTVVEVMNDDMPFLVDSTTAALSRAGGELVMVIHPMIPVERDGEGRLVDLADPGQTGGGGATVESFMQITLRRLPAPRLGEIEDELHRVLGQVRVAVEDWGSMRERCEETLAELRHSPPPLPPGEVSEVADFLEWLIDDHFTFLGTREYRFHGEGETAVARVLHGKGLGLLRDPDFVVFEGLRDLGRLPPEIRHFVRERSLIRITKANALSTVHRPVHLDTVAIKSFDAEGQVLGERLFLGLFTSSAYAARVSEVPILREKVRATVAQCGFPPGSHNAKGLAHVLESYPRDELFQISQEELADFAVGILHLQERPRIALFPRRDPFERFVSCLVYVPRDRYDTRLRLRLQGILEEAFGGELSTYYTQLGDDPLARIHFIVKTSPGSLRKVDYAQLERELIDAGQSWTSRLENALVERLGEERGAEVYRSYRTAFPMAYRETFDPADAVRDVESIARLVEIGGPVLRFEQRPDQEPGEIDLRLFTADRLPPLSNVLPLLERTGLRVLFERAHPVTPDDAPRVWVRALRVRADRGRELDPARFDDYEQAVRDIWHGASENDGFNRLVLFGGLRGREVAVFRAYARYLSQVGVPFSRSSMHAVLARQPIVTRWLFDLFLRKFDPAQAEGRAADVERIQRAIHAQLEQVEDLDEDRILRRFLDLLDCTLRTNYFQQDAAGAPPPHLSFKLDSRRLAGLPAPRPWREIWVYSPEVEGVHLRGGRVARGGIRWSDRREDFRTEVLGLMKAQMVKNAVIVPEGSKGGFVVRRLPEEPEEARAAVVDAYCTLIRGMLDLTDNLVAGEVVPPPRTVRWDDDDTYLVVAADKGTATFSDTANAISEKRGYWLGDAFASGGSAGYDHKKMGITARGAWESVKRHFREQGKDIQNEPFTVVGVGDMGGDVFGNGMLLSHQIRLLAAFNHRHVFLDPDPDPERSWRERKRLFELPRSSWSDYDSDELSPGGGVFSRTAKSIPISPQVAARFGISEREMVPTDLIRRLLRADVELLWFGGIGTYVKASFEDHLDVGDRANDALRIDGREVRAKVVGEGANLAMTQLARIEAEMSGCRLNTDFIDNSAGVDTSDHEVNLKILLGGLVRQGAIDRPQRDRMLREMEDEVAALVLRSNYLQPQAISVTEHLARRLTDRLVTVMRALEREGRLDRRIEFLPSDEELEDRRRQGLGLTRAELAVLLSYTKLDTYRSLVRSPLLDDPALRPHLFGYFPRAVQGMEEAIVAHPLCREIIATVMTNEMVNRVGMAFVNEVSGKTGHEPDQVALAYSAARQILRIPRLWQQIEALDGEVPADVQLSMLAECGRLLERCTVWLLEQSVERVDPGALVESYRVGFVELYECLPRWISGQLAERIEADGGRYEARGVPAELAGSVARLRQLSSAFDIVRIASSRGLGIENVARVYFQLGARFEFDWLRATARDIAPQGIWDRHAIRALVDELFSDQAALTARVLDEIGEVDDSEADLVGAWIERHSLPVEKARALLVDMHSQPGDLGMLAVARRSLEALVHIV